MHKNDKMTRGKKQAMPSGLSPMLCTLTREPIDDADYLYEIKWDGYRIISYVQKGKVRMDSRSAIDYTKRYPPVVDALKKLGHDAVMEVVLELPKAIAEVEEQVKKEVRRMP